MNHPSNEEWFQEWWTMVPLDLAQQYAELEAADGDWDQWHNETQESGWSVEDIKEMVTQLDNDLLTNDRSIQKTWTDLDHLSKSLLTWAPLGTSSEGGPESIDTLITDLWDEHEMSIDMEIFECEENKHDLLSALPEQGLYFVPNQTTHLYPEQAQEFWDCARWAQTHEYDNWTYPPYSSEWMSPTLSDAGPYRPNHQDLNDHSLNQIDNENRLIVSATMTQFGSKFHTATCEFGRIYVPLKYGQYVGDIGQKMRLLIRVKDAESRHPFACIKVLQTIWD